MSDNEILIKMSQEIGKLNGTVKTYMEAQKTTNENFLKISESNTENINKLNASNNKRIGASILAGAFGTTVMGVIGVLTKWFHIGGHSGG